MKKLYRIIALSLLFILVGFSVFYYIGTKKFTERTLFFVEPVLKTLVLEHRLIAEKYDLEKNIELLIKEELLGSSLLISDSVFPVGTHLEHIFLRNGVLYVDLSIEAVFPSEHSGLNFHESLKILERTIRFNFRRIDDIVFTINGNVISLNISYPLGRQG